jgi:hypothetical protein
MEIGQLEFQGGRSKKPGYRFHLQRVKIGLHAWVQISN